MEVENKMENENLRRERELERRFGEKIDHLEQEKRELENRMTALEENNKRNEDEISQLKNEIEDKKRECLQKLTLLEDTIRRH